MASKVNDCEKQVSLLNDQEEEKSNQQAHDFDSKPDDDSCSLEVDSKAEPEVQESGNMLIGVFFMIIACL